MTAPKRDEVDAWWGSCSVNSVLPGLLAALALSGMVIGLAWLLPHDRAAHIIVVGLLSVFWLTLLIFWIYRIFGCNYRLTTCRLFVAIGLKHRKLQIVDLTRILNVVVKASRIERFCGIGRIFLDVQDAAAPLILRGVLGPEQIADRIRGLSGEARKQLASQADVPSPRS